MIPRDAVGEVFEQHTLAENAVKKLAGAALLREFRLPA
jgi:hypothetical protein